MYVSIYLSIYHCIEGRPIKDLSRLNRDLTRVILLDTDKLTWSFYPSNTILLPEYKTEHQLHPIQSVIEGLKQRKFQLLNCQNIPLDGLPADTEHRLTTVKDVIASEEDPSPSYVPGTNSQAFERYITERTASKYRWIPNRSRPAPLDVIDRLNRTDGWDLLAKYPFIYRGYWIDPKSTRGKPAHRRVMLLKDDGSTEPYTGFLPLEDGSTPPPPRIGQPGKDGSTATLSSLTKKGLPFEERRKIAAMMFNRWLSQGSMHRPMMKQREVDDAILDAIEKRLALTFGSGKEQQQQQQQEGGNSSTTTTTSRSVKGGKGGVTSAPVKSNEMMKEELLQRLKAIDDAYNDVVGDSEAEQQSARDEELKELDRYIKECEDHIEKIKSQGPPKDKEEMNERVRSDWMLYFDSPAYTRTSVVDFLSAYSFLTEVHSADHHDARMAVMDYDKDPHRWTIVSEDMRWREMRGKVPIGFSDRGMGPRDVMKYLHPDAGDAGQQQAVLMAKVLGIKAVDSNA